MLTGLNMRGKSPKSSELKECPLTSRRTFYKGAHIVAGCTDSTEPVIIGKWLEGGAHVTCIGGKPDEETLKRIDVSLRLGNAPAPWGLPELSLADEYLTYAAVPDPSAGFKMKRAGKRAHGVIAEDRAVLLSEVLAGKAKAKGLGREIPTDWLLQDIRD